MLNFKSNSILCAGLVALALGSGYARTYQLKKVMIINEVGAGGYAHTDQIAFTGSPTGNYPTNGQGYINSYLAPKYGFKCTIPANQAAIDAVMRDDSLSTYDVVVMNGGTRVGGVGAIGDTGAQHAFQRWMNKGGGTVCIHGLLDHNDTWPWLRDSLLNGTKFTVHSNWGSDPNAQVQWDTLKSSPAQVLSSTKPEYDSIRACFPPLHSHFTFPDEWYSITVNPRPFADVLMTIDEATYTVPAGGAMGLGHPVMWAYHMPASDTAGTQGRIIYWARGHETGAWDGTSTNHAPIAPVAINGVVYSDTSKTLMTKGWIWQALQWAAGLRIPGPVSIHAVDASFGGILEAQNQNGVLQVHVTSKGIHEVNVYTLSGRNVGHSLGNGDAQYSFSNLKGASLYIVRVKSASKTYTQRVML